MPTGLALRGADPTGALTSAVTPCWVTPPCGSFRDCGSGRECAAAPQRRRLAKMSSTAASLGDAEGSSRWQSGAVAFIYRPT